MGWTTIFRDTNRDRQALKLLGDERALFEQWQLIRRSLYPLPTDAAKLVLAYFQEGGWGVRMSFQSSKAVEFPGSKEDYRNKHMQLSKALGTQPKRKK